MHSARLGFLAALALAAGASAQGIERFTFEVTTLGGQTLRDEDFEANVLIVDLWGTWCGPCVQAVPVLEGLYRKYKHYGLEIVGFSYEGADAADPARTVREFAAKHGLTYHLAMGTPAIKQQVPDLRGYPTLLYFTKGMVHDRTQTGFSPLHEKQMESWVRRALGLAPLAGEAEEAAAAERARDLEADAPEPEEPAPEEPEPLPPGVIFQPGDGDTGFDFEVVDADGSELKFQDLRGQVVVLAFTSTWDGEATATAELLAKLHGAHRDEGVAVLAASLEQPAAHAAKVHAIKEFRAKYAEAHGTALPYRIFPAGLDFQKKVHLFSGLPLFLVFDKSGTLVLRERGTSEEGQTYEAITAAVLQHSG